MGELAADREATRLGAGPLAALLFALSAIRLFGDPALLPVLYLDVLEAMPREESFLPVGWVGIGSIVLPILLAAIGERGSATWILSGLSLVAALALGAMAASVADTLPVVAPSILAGASAVALPLALVVAWRRTGGHVRLGALCALLVTDLMIGVASMPLAAMAGRSPETRMALLAGAAVACVLAALPLAWLARSTPGPAVDSEVERPDLDLTDAGWNLAIGAVLICSIASGLQSHMMVESRGELEGTALFFTLAAPVLLLGALFARHAIAKRSRAPEPGIGLGLLNVLALALALAGLGGFAEPTIGLGLLGMGVTIAMRTLAIVALLELAGPRPLRILVLFWAIGLRLGGMSMLGFQTFVKQSDRPSDVYLLVLVFLAWGALYLFAARRSMLSVDDPRPGLLSHLTRVEGRSSVASYWLGWVLSLGATFATIAVAYALAGPSAAVFVYVFALCLTPAPLASLIRRLHDRNLNGWWFLASFVPIVNLWLLIETSFLSGTDGPNRFGEDPRSEHG